METRIFKKLSNGKKTMFFLVCLMVATTGAFAQTKKGETCETQLKNTQYLLSKERTAHEDTKRALQEAEERLDEMEEIIDEQTEQYNAIEAQYNECKNSIKSQSQTGEKEKQQLQTDLQNTKQELKTAEKTISDLKGTLSMAQLMYPIIINSIELENRGEKVKGSVLSSPQMRHLYPKIRYTSLLSQSKTITLKVKIYKPDGSLCFNPLVSTSYTTSKDVSIGTSTGTAELTSWGNEKKSVFSAGIYRIEIWYDNVCLGQKSFEILKK